MSSVKHYAMLGAYLGAVAVVVSIVRALPELPAKLKEGWGSASESLEGLAFALLVIVGLPLLGALIGGLVGWAKL